MGRCLGLTPVAPWVPEETEQSRGCVGVERPDSQDSWGPEELGSNNFSLNVALLARGLGAWSGPPCTLTPGSPQVPPL